MSVSILVFLGGGRNPRPKRPKESGAKWHKTIKIKSFMILLINPKLEKEMIR